MKIKGLQLKRPSETVCPAHLTYVRSMRDSKLDGLNNTHDTHVHTTSDGPRPHRAKQVNTHVKSPLHYPKASSAQDVTQLPSDCIAMAQSASVPLAHPSLVPFPSAVS